MLIGPAPILVRLCPGTWISRRPADGAACHGRRAPVERCPDRHYGRQLGHTISLLGTDMRFGSEADMRARARNVRFTPTADIQARAQSLHLLMGANKEASGSLSVLDANLFGYDEPIVRLDTAIAHGTLDLGVPQHQLDRAQVAGSAIDQRPLRSLQRMCTIEARVEFDDGDP